MLLIPTLVAALAVHAGPGALSPQSAAVAVTIPSAAAPIDLPQTAAAGVRRAIESMARGVRLPLTEVPTLSRGLQRGAEMAARTDSVRATSAFKLPPAEAHYYIYTASDTSQVPVFVSVMAQEAKRYGVAVTFRKTPTYPNGVYWIALALLDT